MPLHTAALLTALVVLFGVVSAAEICVPGNSVSTLFCSSGVDYNVSSSTQFIVQDSLAKQTVDIVLNQIINAKGVFVTAECANNFKAYSCAVNFPKCQPDGTLQRPCRSMCSAYCDACFVSSCPCADLPETDCFTITPDVVPTQDDGNGATSAAVSMLSVFLALVMCVLLV